MQKILTLLCITAILFMLPERVEGQSPSGAAAGALSNMDKAVNAVDSEVTPADAYYLGRAVAANILSVYKPYTQNQELTQYVNNICQTLAINSSQPTAFNGYHVIILDTLEYNAFATSGGHIFITKGLINSATTEDMLAAVIAHELAHIILKHSVNMINEVKITDDMMAVANRAANTAASNMVNAGQLLYFREAVTKSIDTLMKNGYSQTQEFNADLEAMVILAYAGYDPTALIDMLKILQRVQITKTGGFNVTHPSPQQRVANLEQLRYRVSDTRKFRAPRFKKIKS